MPLSDPTSPMENPARNPYSVLYGRWTHRLFRWLLISGLLAVKALGQQDSYTWQQIRERFEASNSTLLAGKLNIDELRAQEISANLRPNPDFTLSADGTQIAPSKSLATVRRHLRFTGSQLSFRATQQARAAF